MDENLYDEFGNYIGKLEDEEQEEKVEIQDKDEDSEKVENIFDEEEEITKETKTEPVKSRAVVLHEDKKYYPSAEEIYGPDVETMVQDEDTQPLEKPIIQPKVSKQWNIREEIFPDTLYKKEYLIDMLNYSDFNRNIVFLGHLHHGKTTLMDLLVKETHTNYTKFYDELRYTDHRIDEQKRKISLKASPMSLLLENSKSKHYLYNIMDTPGHPNFSDEVSASIRLADGAVIIVDAVEGVMSQTEKLIKHALQERLSIVLFINKLDRLILELKLPPEDAYLKLVHTIKEVNMIIQASAHGMDKPPILSPELGNVCFGSAYFGWSFTLLSFARIYSNYYKSFDPEIFATKLWGELYLNPETRKFQKEKPKIDKPKRSFIQFILEPLFKIYSHIVGKDLSELAVTLKKIGVKLSKEEIKYDIKPLLKVILNRFFGHSHGFVDMVNKFIPSPNKSNNLKTEHLYTGPLDSKEAQSMMECDSKGPLFIYITKLYEKEDLSAFDAFGRVMSGTIKVGDEVKVLGESYSKEDQEDMTVKKVTKLSIQQTRYKIDIQQAVAGNWVLIEGIDTSIMKTATIVSKDYQNPYIFRPLTFNTISVIKISVEPLNPSELPKMVEGLRKLNKSYPLLTTKVEESGEHVLLGTGELFFDCVLHDLRELYSEIEIKVSDPIVSFSETVSEISPIKTYAETPNKKNKIAMISGPLDKGLSDDIENGKVSLDWGKKKLGEFFKKYDWDILEAHSIWTFGPDDNGPNLLLNETIPTEIDPKLLNTCKDSIIRGFKWGTREGPLCDEPMRNVKFKILGATISDDPIYRGSGQIIPTARRVVYSSFLMSTPKMMEPIYFTEIQTPLDSIKAVYNVLDRRRGHVTLDIPKPGSPLYTIHAFVPCIDSFGLETDIRSHTQGQAFCLSSFHHWSIAPGDPLDKSIVLRPLEPSPPNYLAREFMVKTRKRKGLSEDVSIEKFFDDPMLIELSKKNVRDQVNENLLKYTN